MEGAKISIVIPSFNSEKTIAKCIDSILDQSYTQKEVIIADGVSTDSTLSILQEYVSKYDFIKLKSQKDQGVYDAMNKGTEMTTGEWVLFLGSDDSLYDADVLNKISGRMRDFDGGMLYGNVLVQDDSSWALDKSIYDGQFSIEKLLLKNICHQSIFYRKVLFEQLGKFSLDYPVCADWDFNFRCFAYCKVEYVDMIVANFQGGGLSTQKTNDKFTDWDIVYNIRKYFKIRFTHAYFSRLGSRFFTIAGVYLKTGEFLKGVYFLFLAIYHAKNKLASIRHLKTLLASKA